MGIVYGVEIADDDDKYLVIARKALNIFNDFMVQNIPVDMQFQSNASQLIELPRLPHTAEPDRVHMGDKRHRARELQISVSYLVCKSG